MGRKESNHTNKHPLWESVIVLCFALGCFMSILDSLPPRSGRERAGCYALFVFVVSRDCCVALLRGSILVFPEHTH